METGEPEHQKLQRLEELFWVVEAQAGNTDAFIQLMSRYEKRLLYYLRRIVPEGDWALDLHQEVWLDAYRGLASLQAPEAFRVWIYRIAHHKAARFIRNEKLRERAAEVLTDPALQEPALETPLEAEVLHQALQRLDPPEREVLVLHYLRDLSTQELAAVLDCPTGTVKSRLYHARAALRRIIERKHL
jgi:RNA polymerase sigma-70 factor (ECF subfamily)